jgi:FlaA1/EpsC-like NDP-sugar epimerase
MLKKKLDTLFSTVRSNKIPLAIGIDGILVLISLFLAYLIRLGSISEIGEKYIYQILVIAVIIIPVKILVFWYFRLYHISFRFISLNEVISIIKASAISSPLIALIALVLRDKDIMRVFPRSVIFIDFFLTFFFITAIRAFFRLYYAESPKKRGLKTLIVGAGAAGEQLVREMLSSPQLGYMPTGLIDENPEKRKTLIHGIRILGSKKDIPKVVRDLGVKEIIIAIPSATSQEMRAVMDEIRKTDVKDVKVLPSISDLMNGKVALKDIRNISIEDLLGREPVKIDTTKVLSYIRNNNILVTGAGGSIGSELCRQIPRFDPAILIMLDMGETELFKVDMEIREKYPDVFVLPIVGDIRDEKKIERVFEERRIDAIFHAAAYKHVPLMEANPREAIVNNIYGTKVLGKTAAKYGVKRFVNISTDKAVNPKCVMGATKRVAENLLLGFGVDTTAFVSVRFGNVLGSRGSVVPIFQEQIEKGGPITITNSEMKRYFMTIPEAVQLVMQAGAMGQGGDVFVLDMGAPVSIYKVAEELIKLSGFEPDKDIPIIISGSRPGEKLFEELLTAEEGSIATLHEKIYSARITLRIGRNYLKKIDMLISLAKENTDTGRVLSLLKELVPSYQKSRRGQ